MAEDMTLSAGIELEDQSAIEDLTADIGGTTDGGGQAGGGMGGGIMDMLGNMTGLLKFATVALGVIMSVPGLLSGVMRLLEVALLPIGVLFQSLLAPLLQRMLKWLVQNDIIGRIERFASQVVDSIQNFIAGLDPLISAINNFLTDDGNTISEQVEEDVPQAIDTALKPGKNVAENIQRVREAQGDLATGDTSGALETLKSLVNDIIDPTAEFSSSARDNYSAETTSQDTQEDQN